MRITSKKQLQKSICYCEKNVNWFVYGDKKRNIFDEGIKAIKQSLATLSDELPLCKFESLEFEKDFPRFVSNSREGELNVRLTAMADDLSRLCRTYQKYLPLIEQEVDYHKAKKLRLPKKQLPQEFASKSTFAKYIKSSDLADIEQKFKSILTILRTNAAFLQKEKGGIPTGTEQANMRLRLAERMDSIALRLPEGQALRESLIAAANELKGMIFPKSDKGVLQCYLLLMEALDDVGTVAEETTVSRMKSLMDQWKSLSR